MKKLKYEEKRNLMREYPNYLGKIRVTDFESACRRSEQVFVSNIRKILARKKMLYLLRSIKANNYRIEYTRRLYQMSKASQKRFCSIMKNKYGSVKNYWSLMR